MTRFEELWDSLLVKRPMLGDDDAKVMIEAAQLRRLLRQFFEQGQKDEQRRAKTIRDIFRKAGLP